jgi:hypothetical protein
MLGKKDSAAADTAQALPSGARWQWQGKRRERSCRVVVSRVPSRSPMREAMRDG